MRRNNLFLFISFLVCGILIVFVDQITKYIIVENFVLGQSKEFINGFIELVYIHNRGGAWGFMSGKTWFLLLFTSIILVGCIVFMYINRNKNRLLLWSILFIISGGIGNLIDRIFRDGNVVDFLQFDFWKSFPIFNVADISVVFGVGLFILYFIIDTINDLKKSKVQNEGN